MANQSIALLDSVDLSQVNSMMANISKFQAIVQATLKKGHDYDTIPGTQKPTLLKPGAEKILMLLGLTSEYQIVSQIEDYANGEFAYTVRCLLTKGDNKITEGLGSCNSREDKYRWRWIPENDIPNGVDPENLKQRTTKWGKTQYRIENDEICSQANTILKMAKKRAQIDATLTVAALSEVFTQDMEDLKGLLQAEELDNLTEKDAGHAKVTFGKHKGKTLQEVAAEDMGYIKWLAENAREEGMRKAAQMLVEGAQKPPERVDVKGKGEAKAPVTPPPNTPPYTEETQLPWEENNNG